MINIEFRGLEIILDLDEEKVYFIDNSGFDENMTFDKPHTITMKEFGKRLRYHDYSVARWSSLDELKLYRAINNLYYDIVCDVYRGTIKESHELTYELLDELLEEC